MNPERTFPERFSGGCRGGFLGVSKVSRGSKVFEELCDFERISKTIQEVSKTVRAVEKDLKSSESKQYIFREG